MLDSYEIKGYLFNGHLALPGSGEGPGLLLLYAWWGLNPFIIQTCERLAQAGFVTLAPDYYGGEIACTIYEATAYRQRLDRKAAQKLAAQAVDYLSSQPSLTSSSIGVMGFSLGCSFALEAARSRSKTVKAVVLFYGSGGGKFGKTQAAFLGHFAENDQWGADADKVESLAGRIRSTGQEAVFFEAAKGLHAEQGLQGTSYEEIAAQAGTAQATVYRHFPTLEDLIPACASSIVVLQHMTPEAAENLFTGRSRPLQRIEWIIQGTCDCYARDGGWLQAARREGDLIPALAEVVQVEQKSLRTLVRAALKDTGASERIIQVLAALIDFPLWKSLRDVGFNAAEATSQILDLVHDQLAKENLI